MGSHFTEPQRWFGPPLTSFFPVVAFHPKDRDVPWCCRVCWQECSRNVIWGWMVHLLCLGTFWGYLHLQWLHTIAITNTVCAVPPTVLGTRKPGTDNAWFWTHSSLQCLSGRQTVNNGSQCEIYAIGEDKQNAVKALGGVINSATNAPRSHLSPQQKVLGSWFGRCRKIISYNSQIIVPCNDRE